MKRTWWFEPVQVWHYVRADMATASMARHQNDSGRVVWVVRLPAGETVNDAPEVFDCAVDAEAYLRRSGYVAKGS
jgi:hypothetical protein